MDHFPIQHVGTGWQLSWPDFRNISRATAKTKLFDLIFDRFNADQVIVGIVSADFTGTVTIPAMTWHQKSDTFIQWMDEQYTINSIILPTAAQAVAVKTYLEQQLMWRTLSTQELTA